MKYNSYTLKKAEKLLDEAGYILRYEKGNFNSGFCILEDKNIVIINKYFEVEAKVGAIIDIISNIKIDKTKLSEKSLDFLKAISQLKFDDL